MVGFFGGRAAFALVALSAGCIPIGPYDVGSTGGGSGGGTTATSTSTSTSTSGAGGFWSTCGIDNSPRPKTVPDSWEQWSCYPTCSYWLPPDEASMPAPIQWEPCPSAADVTGCQRMATDWSDGIGNAIGTQIGFWVDEQNVARLFVTRSAWNGQGDEDSYTDWVVGGVDGEPLDFAMRKGYSTTCSAVGVDLGTSSFVFDAYGPGEDVDGVIVGRLGSRVPELSYRNEDPGIDGWWGGSDWIVRLQYGSVATLYSHDGSWHQTLYTADMDPDGLAFNAKPWILGHEVVFETASYWKTGIWAYDEIRGTHPLINYTGDLTRGASNVGTDGKDLVWTYGEGLPDDLGLYPTNSIMTAPFTTDPSMLAPKRLRSDLSKGMGTHELQFGVGCGFAGRIIATGRDVEIVRLSDGAGWVLQGNDDWKWNHVLGFTCEEVFVTVFDQPTQQYGIARVPLVSLGDPSPPD